MKVIQWGIKILVQFPGNSIFKFPHEFLKMRGWPWYTWVFHSQNHSVWWPYYPCHFDIFAPSPTMTWYQKMWNFLAHLLIYVKSLPHPAPYQNAHAKFLKMDFRFTLPRKLVRVWYYWKWFLKLHNLKLFSLPLDLLRANQTDDLPHILPAELTKNIPINDSISAENLSDTSTGSEQSINHHNYIKMNIFSSENILGFNKMSVLFLFVVYHQ